MSARLKPLARISPLAMVALPVVLLISSFMRSQNVATSTKAAVAGLAVWTMLRPTQALLAVAGLLPLSTALTALLGTSVAASSVAEIIVLTFLLSVIVRGAILGARGIPLEPALTIPALLFSVIVAASAAVSIAPIAHVESTTVLAIVWRHLTQYVGGPAGVRPVWEAALLLEGVGLLVAIAALSRLSADLGAALVRMIAAGATAAAALNLNRLIEVVLRTGGGLASLPRYYDQFRINVHYADVNAAGAYFLMTGVISAVLAITSPGFLQKLAWSIATVVIAAALWLTGSRAPILVALLVGLAALSAVARRWYASGRIPVFKVAIVVLALSVAGVALARHPRMSMRYITHPGDARGVYERLGWASAGFRMLATDPLFGIGVGGFYPNSVRFTIPEPPAPENAHSNYLQILAEIGIIGFGMFLWVVIVPLHRWWRCPGRLRWRGELGGVSIGVIAFLIVSSAMHPLLVREVAYQFWIMLGALTGLATRNVHEEDVAPAPSRVDAAGARRRWVVPAVLVVGAMAAALPIRMQRAIQNADLSDRSAGFSGHWETWNDGRRYRRAGSIASFFVASNATSVVIPLRADASHGPIRVEILLDGDVANVVTVPADRWQDVRVVLPPRRAAPRSRQLELRASVAPVAATGRPLLVGRPTFTVAER